MLKIVQDVMNNFADAIKTAKIDIVPKTVITSGGKDNEAGIPNAFESLVMLLLSDKLGMTNNAEVHSSPEAKKLKEEIFNKIANSNLNTNTNPSTNSNSAS